MAGGEAAATSAVVSTTVVTGDGWSWAVSLTASWLALTMSLRMASENPDVTKLANENGTITAARPMAHFR